MLAALGVIPVVILLHVLRPKPKRVQVTTLFLWNEVLRDRGSRVAFKRLRKNLPLLLQILLITLAALALARPVWLRMSQQHGSMILVMDTSASMQARAGDDSRFEQARREAVKLIDDHADSDQFLVIEAGPAPHLHEGFLPSAVEARDAVRGLQPTDAPGDLDNALYLALSFVEPDSDDTIYLVTDGAGYDFLKLLQIPQRILPVVVGGNREITRNLAITKFEFRQQFAAPNQYEIMLEIHNFSDDEHTAPLRLSVDNTVIVETDITLDAGQRRLMIFPYSGLLTGIARAEIDVDDDLDVDNSAALALSASKDVWVLLATPGNYFLERLLEAYPNFLVNTVDNIPADSWPEMVRSHDLVIVDRLDAPPTDSGNLLLLDALSPSIPLAKTGETAFPEVFDWDEAHPVLADVNLSGLTIERTNRLEPVDPAADAGGALSPLVEAPDTGLIYAYERGDLRAVVVGFDVTRSDLPLKVAFPVMMSNIVNWLNPNRLSFSALKAQAGDPFAIQVARDTTAIRVRAPDGEWAEYPITERPLLFTDTWQTGTYTILENKKSRYFTVNLVDAAESDITVPPIDMTSYIARLTADSQETTGTQPLWAWLIASGIAFILVEWFAWLKVG